MQKSRDVLLFLAHVFSDSPKRLHAVASLGDSVREIQTQLPKHFRDFPSRSKDFFLRRAMQFQLSKTETVLDKHGITPLYITDPVYPTLLREIPFAPPVLFTIGKIHLLHNESIAVVGPRIPSDYGKEMAHSFCKDLHSKLAIVSGMAAGIDAIAHRTTLEANEATIGVLGGCVTTRYPAENHGLYDIMAKNGLLVSEFPPGTAAIARNFPQRNRIVAGMSRGVLVVEAGERSGALITARLALESGRDVFVIPGNINTPSAAGSNLLIRDGADLVTAATDVLSAWGFQTSSRQNLAKSIADNVAPATLSQDEAIIWEFLAPQQPQHIDAIVQGTGLSASATMGILSILELKNHIRQVSMNQFVRHAS